MSLLLAAADPLTREAAQEAARRELGRRPYADSQPPLLLRLVGEALRRVGSVLERATAQLGDGALARVLLVLVLAVVAGVVLARLGPLRRAPTAPAVLGPGPVRSAAEHRAASEALAAQGRFDEAVRERLRAVVRELETRGVLDPRAARTADEVAREAGSALPAVADGLRAAARVFDETWYGGRPAGAAQLAVLVGGRRRGARPPPRPPVTALAPAPTSTAPTGRALWRRARGPLAVLALLVAAAVAVAAVKAAGTGGQLDPRSYAPAGGRGAGHPARRPRRPGARRADLASLSARRRPGQHRPRARTRGRSRSRSSAAVATPRWPPRRRRARWTATSRRCGVPAQARPGRDRGPRPGLRRCRPPATAGPALTGGAAYVVAGGTGATGCYAAEGHPSLLAVGRAARPCSAAGRP